MRLKVNNVRVSLLEETSVKEAAAKKLGLKKQDIENLQIVRRAVDARRKNNISLNYHVLIDLEISSKQLGRLVKDKDVTLLTEESLVEPDLGVEKIVGRPLVIGAGPAGLLAALELASYAYRPLILEHKEWMMCSVFGKTENLIQILMSSLVREAPVLFPMVN